MASFRSQVGRGSDAHYLLGEALTAVMTLSMLTVLKLSSPGALPLVYCGDGTDDVATSSRTSVILLLKRSVRTSTVQLRSAGLHNSVIAVE